MSPVEWRFAYPGGRFSEWAIGPLPSRGDQVVEKGLLNSYAVVYRVVAVRWTLEAVPGPPGEPEALSRLTAQVALAPFPNGVLQPLGR